MRRPSRISAAGTWMGVILALSPTLPLAANEYRIDLTIDPVKGTLHGLQKVIVRNETEAPIDSLILEAPGLPGNPAIPGSDRWKILSLLDPKGKLLPFTWKASDETYTAPVSPPLEVGSQWNLSVEYERPISAGESVAGYLDLNDRGPGAWYLKIRSFRAGSLGSDDFKDFSVNLAVPEGWVAVSTGAPPPKGGRVVPGKVTLAVKGARAFGIALGDRFRTIQATAGSIPISVFHFEGEEEWARRALGETVDAVEHYTGLLGAIPVSRIAVLPAPPGGVIGASSPGLITVPRTGSPDLLREAISLEAARQVWGWSLGDASNAVPFVSNGLAIWCQQHYLAKKNGIDLHAQFLRSGINDTYLVGVLRGYDTTILRPEAERKKIDWDFDRIVARAKSAVVIHMLGNLLGEEKLLEAVRGFLKARAGRIVTDRDFQEAAQSVSPTKLDGFFDQWLRSKSSLDYYLSHVQVERKEAGTKVHADVWKTGTAAMPVEIDVQDTAGKKVRTIFPADRASGEMVIPIEAPFASITLDPRGILPMISRVGAEGRLDLAEALLVEGKLLRAGEQIDQVLSDSPEDPRALFLKGRVMKERGDWAAALSLWGRLIASASAADTPAEGAPGSPQPLGSVSPTGRDFAAVWARIWSARLFDLQGKREEATALYTSVASLPDLRGSRAAARAGLEKPFEDAWPPFVP